MKILFYIFSITLFTSCEQIIRDNIPEGKIVLFYIGGNNNLTYEVNEKINAIKSAWKEIGENSTNKLFILYTTKHEPATLVEVGFLENEPVLYKLKEYQNQKTSNPDLLSLFINGIKENYPAYEYGLTIFSHGSGWLPNYSLNDPTSRSIMNDNGYEMELVNFSKALPSNLLNFIIFEVCFMGGIEVAYQLRNKANYILFSPTEILSPGFTDIYYSGLKYLYEGKAGIISFAKDYYNLYQSKGGLQQSATVSVIKTDELENLAEFLKQNKLFNGNINIQKIQAYDRKFKNLFFDFEDYYSHFLTSDNFQLFKNKLNKIVLYKACTDSFIGKPIIHYSGLSTYILQEEYPILNRSYTNLDWYKAIN